MAFCVPVAAVHRCSRCGQTGHNVRNCPSTRWFPQLCSLCGEPGHNARNCARTRAHGERCPVCDGRGTLPCGRCHGTGVLPALRAPTRPFSPAALRRLRPPLRNHSSPPAPPLPPQTPRALNAQQREWARLARERARVLRGVLHDRPQDYELIGGAQSKQRTTRDESATDHDHDGDTLLVGNDEDELIGGQSVQDVRQHKWWSSHERFRLAQHEGAAKCSRCSGLGYLCCLSCSD